MRKDKFTLAAKNSFTVVELQKTIILLNISRKISLNVVALWRTVIDEVLHMTMLRTPFGSPFEKEGMLQWGTEFCLALGSVVTMLVGPSTVAIGF